MAPATYPDFYHDSLTSDSIRLLRLLPSNDENTPIKCELFHYPLHDKGTRTQPYEALSYVWGSPAETQPIFIRAQNSQNEQIVHITVNLHEALLRLRTHYLDRILWVDAVCINQENTQEKEQQIQLMAKTYGLANRVVVWLGESADDSDQALRELRHAGGHSPENISDSESLHHALITLLDRPWFRRIWVTSWLPCDYLKTH